VVRRWLSLLAEDLLAEDVGAAAVLSQLAQHVEIDETQRERAAVVAPKNVIQSWSAAA